MVIASSRLFCLHSSRCDGPFYQEGAKKQANCDDGSNQDIYCDFFVEYHFRYDAKNEVGDKVEKRVQKECFPFLGKRISLIYEDAETAEAVLLEDGYSRQESAPDNYHIYRMIFVSISLKYDEDNVIVEMGISVNDPFEENIDY